VNHTRISGIAMADVAILGATGPTGIHLANILRGQNVAVRVVSRSAANLQHAFGNPAFEKVATDVLDADAVVPAVDGCRLAYDCPGLPADQMRLHPAAAQNIAKAVRATGARCIQVSSYWAYLPLQRSPLNETHPRSGGPEWVRWRREAEDLVLGKPEMTSYETGIARTLDAISAAAAKR